MVAIILRMAKGMDFGHRGRWGRWTCVNQSLGEGQVLHQRGTLEPFLDFSLLIGQPFHQGHEFRFLGLLVDFIDGKDQGLCLPGSLYPVTGRHMAHGPVFKLSCLSDQVFGHFCLKLRCDG